MIESEKINNLTSLLNHGKNECIEKIDKTINPSSQDLNTKILTSTEFANLISEVTLIMGKYLKSFFNDVWANDNFIKSEEERKFYFWPGYQQYSPYSEGRWDTGDVKKDLKSISESCSKHGIGYKWLGHNTNQDQIKFFPLHIWFYLFYGQSLGNFRLQGFTKWFEFTPTLYLEDNNSTNGAKIYNQLCAIELSINYKYEVPKYNVNAGKLEIAPIPSKTSKEFLNPYLQVINKINVFFERIKEQSQCEFKPFKDDERKYLFPPFCKKDSSIPFSSTDINNRKLNDINDAFNEIFSLLFFSIFYDFNNEDEIIIRTSLERIENEILPFSENKTDINLFIQRIEMAQSLLKEAKNSHNKYGFKEETFKYYTVIPMNRSLRIIGAYKIDSYLGTLNFYTSHSIEPHYLSMIKNWVETIYEQLRLIEALISNRETVKRDLNSYHKHELFDLISLINFDSSDKDTLDLLRTYFYFVFDDEFIPEDLEYVPNIKDWIISVSKWATKLQLLEHAAKMNQRPFNKNELNKSVEQIFKKVDTTGIDINFHINAIFISHQKELSRLLISAFRNVIKWIDEDRIKIELKLTKMDNWDVIQIINLGKERAVFKNPDGTFRTMCKYLSLYNKDFPIEELMKWLDQDSLIYRTVIPLP